jgi:hypothetical protein
MGNPMPDVVWLRRGAAVFSSLVLTAVACGPRAPAQSPGAGAQFPCRVQPAEFAHFVHGLPAKALVAPLEVDVAQSTIGSVPGPGPILQVSPDAAVADGTQLAGSTPEARILAFGQWAEARWPGGSASGDSVVHIAAHRDVDVQTLRAFAARIPESVELRLLVRTVADSSTATTEGDSQAKTLAGRLLMERDPGARQKLAREGYATFSKCAALSDAVDAVDAADPAARWPELRERLAAALPTCRCDELDTDGLGQIIVAEQRAGTAALGSVPLTFLRDARCGASMPLRSVGKLLGQIEEFDAEFSGRYTEDAIAFDEVVTNERLLNYFCNALPGETLAALQRRRATVYQRVAAPPGCEAWQFQPIAPGSPIGTLRRVSEQDADLSLHYRQAAEELRVFGPAGADSKPTDDGPWTCTDTFKLTGIEPAFVEYEGGQWFFREADCRSAADVSAKPIACAVPEAEAAGASESTPAGAGEAATPKEASAAQDAPPPAATGKRVSPAAAETASPAAGK